MTFEHLAADVVGLLDHLGIERADVFGFSLGGLTTYELLVRPPGSIRRAVVASADHRNDRGGEVSPRAPPNGSRLRRHARRLRRGRARPGPLRGVRREDAAMVHGFGGWTDDQLRAIEVPVLVLIGDTDFILVPNAAEAAELLPQGQLAVLPGTTHMDMTRSELVAPVVEAFLRRDVRRATGTADNR